MSKAMSGVVLDQEQSQRVRHEPVLRAFGAPPRRHGVRTRTVKVVPRPGSEWTRMAPPHPATSWRTRNNPRPAPAGEAVEQAALLGFREAAAVVPHPPLDPFRGAARPHVEGRGAAAAGLDGVADQVNEYESQAPARNAGGPKPPAENGTRSTSRKTANSPRPPPPGRRRAATTASTGPGSRVSRPISARARTRPSVRWARSARRSRRARPSSSSRAACSSSTRRASPCKATSWLGSSWPRAFWKHASRRSSCSSAAAPGSPGPGRSRNEGPCATRARLER